jgi:hypothetical protein
LGRKTSGLLSIREKSEKLKEKSSNLEKVSGNTVLPVKLEEDFKITEDKETNEFLVKKSIEVLRIQAKASVDLGKVFKEVHEKLAGDNHHNGVYTVWLEKNGFNKMTAIRHRRRYELYTMVNSENGKAFVATLPVRIIDSIYRQEDISGIAATITEGITRKELENMIASPEIFGGVDILPYDPKEAEKLYSEIGNIYKKVSLDKISEDNKDAFEKDMKRIEKILSKWSSS